MTKNGLSVAQHCAAAITANMLLGAALGKVSAAPHVNISWLPLALGAVVGFALTPVLVLASNRSSLAASFGIVAVLSLAFAVVCSFIPHAPLSMAATIMGYLGACAIAFVVSSGRFAW